MSEQNAANERNYWTKEEIKNFLFITKNELSLRDHVIFQLLIYTGARKGELLAISWEDIDFEARSLKLWKTLFQTDGKHLLQTPKTRDSKRLISLDTQSLSLLKKWRIIQMEENLAFGSRNANNNIIFTRPDGTPLRLAYLNEKLNILIKRHNLHPITIHGLRHTHASLLFEAGANIKEVQERLGHSDIQMTMNDYTHVTVY
ncbi:site-specific integrase [Metabacillus sediminilitoris]|nr:site-specific integrase [Metabacillus sediminilitoris]